MKEFSNVSPDNVIGQRCEHGFHYFSLFPPGVLVYASSTSQNTDKTFGASLKTTSVVEKLHLHTDNPSAVEARNVEDKVLPNSAGGLPPKKQNSRIMDEEVRRSGRLKNSPLSAGSPGVKSVVELVQNEKEVVLHSQQISIFPVLKDVEDKMRPNSKGLPLKEENSRTTSEVRRSERLKNSAVSARSQGVKHVVEQLNLVENKKEEALYSHKIGTFPVLKAVENGKSPNSNGLPPEKENSKTTSEVRRSGRLKNSALSAGSPVVKYFGEHVNLVENRKEEALPSQQICTLPVTKEVENKTPPNSDGLPSKKENSRITNAIVRRSGHLTALSVQSQGIKPVVEHANLVENEKEEAPHSQQISTLPILIEKSLEGEQVQQASAIPNVNYTNLEEKVNHLIQAVDEFKSQTVEQVARRLNEDNSPGISYKTLYFESQRKIEALMEENYELVRKLEFARGQIAAYEKMKDPVTSLKEVILFPNLGRATEATVSLAPQMIQSFASPAGASTGGAGNDPKQKKNMYGKRKVKA